ncbi:STM4014 family protein [Catelliglobosispora koreensis]|uniref:STM4014 family protein n=1 Tax=Catelliglobosispora koreensis TaxID=129052 RepID=UPI0003814E1A|nr:STM4014 family protein [Catelliglobosispora koreensis]
MSVRLAVVGNPGSRRVALLAAAAARQGLEPPRVVPWLTVLRGDPVSFEAGSLVRIESPGEDAEVDRLLRGAAVPALHGEITDGAAWFGGFSSSLDTIATAAAGSRLLAQPDDIRTMFDKSACHRVLSAAGIPVPAALPGPVTGWDSLRAALDAAGWRRVFVKSRFGSSASGVLALEFGPHGRLQATTSVELAGNRLFNSLRVRRYHTENDIAAIVDRLAPGGLHVEKWFPKAGIDGHVVDFRVVVLNGQPSHVVARGSKWPMTNLHLGGKRLPLSSIPAGSAFDAGLRTCADVAALFPGTAQMGVDLMVGTGWQRHAIAEVNAFGDLLPGLLFDGRDTYEAQLVAL